MLAEAAEDSAAQVAPGLGSVIGDYRAADDLLAFAAGCEILTFEREDVPEELLAKLEPQTPQLAVRPSPATFRLVRDKAALGDWLSSLGAAAGPAVPRPGAGGRGRPAAAGWPGLGSWPWPSPDRQKVRA